MTTTASQEAIFEALRPRLHGISYRMLGSVADAQDLVQDVWLKWNGISLSTILNPEAWLVTSTTRLAIDRLRTAKVQREQYAGIWIPEPILQDDGATPESSALFANEVSIAFLMMLERLAPEARAAFVLRDVFDADYEQIAQTLGKTVASCRQIVHRARLQVKSERPRYVVPAHTHLQLMQSFVRAMTSGDLDHLSSLLAEEAVLIGDGGGKVTSFPKPLVGGSQIAQLLRAGYRRYGLGMRLVLASVNGNWAVLRFVDELLESVQSFETDGARVTQIYVQRNPDKLARIAQAYGTVPKG